jgi:NADH dehydrogenase FAD-containing subunit
MGLTVADVGRRLLTSAAQRILTRAILPLGRSFAVLQTAGVRLSGFMAWLVWALIHIQFLAEASLRWSVFLQWMWTYVSGKRAERLIIRQRIND